MRTLRQVCAASVLTLMLALSAFAGEIDTTLTSQQQRTQPVATQGENSMTRAGEIQTTMTEIALNLLQGVLSLI